MRKETSYLEGRAPLTLRSSHPCNLNAKTDLKGDSCQLFREEKTEVPSGEVNYQGLLVPIGIPGLSGNMPGRDTLPQLLLPPGHTCLIISPSSPSQGSAPGRSPCILGVQHLRLRDVCAFPKSTEQTSGGDVITMKVCLTTSLVIRRYPGGTPHLTCPKHNC